MAEDDQLKTADIAARLCQDAEIDLVGYLLSQEGSHTFENCVQRIIQHPHYSLSSLERDFNDIMGLDTDLKCDEFYLLITQNEVALIFSFIRYLSKIRFFDQDGDAGDGGGSY